MSTTDLNGETIQAFWSAATPPRKCPVCHQHTYFNPYAGPSWQAQFVHHWNTHHAGKSIRRLYPVEELPYVPMPGDTRWSYFSGLCSVQGCIYHLVPYVDATPEEADLRLKNHIMYRHVAPRQMPVLFQHSRSTGNLQPRTRRRIARPPPAKLRKAQPGYFDPSLPSLNARNSRPKPSRIQKTQTMPILPETLNNTRNTVAKGHARSNHQPGPSTSQQGGAAYPIVQSSSSSASQRSQEYFTHHTGRSPSNDLRRPRPTRSFLENAYLPPSPPKSHEPPLTPLKPGQKRSVSPLTEPLPSLGKRVRWAQARESTHTDDVQIVGPSKPATGVRPSYPERSAIRSGLYDYGYFDRGAQRGAPWATVTRATVTGSAFHAKVVEALDREFSRHPSQDTGLDTSEFPKPMSRAPTPNAMRQTTGLESDHEPQKAGTERYHYGKRQGTFKSAAVGAMYPGPVRADTPAGVKGLYGRRG